MLESKIEQKVVDYCRKRGIYTRKFSSPAHRGVPDRILIHDGKVLFLELKRVGNKTTALQEQELHALRRHGVRAEVATGFDMAKAVIDGLWLPSKTWIVELI